MASSLARALDSMDAVTAVSRDLARQAAEVLRLSSQPMVIPNFLTPRRIKSKTAGLNEKPRILHASNFRPIKDPVGVALIFKEIRRQFESELWLVGQGRGLDRVRTVLTSNGIEKDTRYFGLQPDIADILSSGDLFLLPSLSESFGLAALEAMACGLPVLATEVGGLPEVVLHDRTGFLFPPGDYDSAAELAVGLLSRPRAYQSMSHAAKEHARGFDLRKTVAMYEVLYKDAIAAIRAIGN